MIKITCDECELHIKNGYGYISIINDWQEEDCNDYDVEHRRTFAKLSQPLNFCSLECVQEYWLKVTNSEI